MMAWKLLLIAVACEPSILNNNISRQPTFLSVEQQKKQKEFQKHTTAGIR
jgi:hypothetical protein